MTMGMPREADRPPPSMARRAAGWAGILLVGLLVWPPAPRAWEPVRHSGKVERIDLAEGIVVVGQLARHGNPERRVIHVGDDTPVVTVRRPRPWDSYEEIRLSLLEVLVGDFVVVESVEREGRLLALKITVLEPRRPGVPPRPRRRARRGRWYNPGVTPADLAVEALPGRAVERLRSSTRRSRAR
jgi:hypothetical protein